MGKKLIWVILAIVAVIVLVLGVVAYDIVSSVQTARDIDPDTLIGEPSVELAPDNTEVAFLLPVDIPEFGFIEKGVVVQIDFTVEVTSFEQTTEQEITMGDNETLEFTVSLDQVTQALLEGANATGFDLGYKVTITPKLAGYEVQSFEINDGMIPVSPP